MASKAAPAPVAPPADPSVYPSSRDDGKFTALAALLASVAIGRAVQLGDGMYTPQGMPWLLAAHLAVLAAVLLPRAAPLERLADAGSLPVGLALLAWQVAQLLTFGMPAKYLQFTQPLEALMFSFYLAFLAVVAGAAACARPAGFKQLAGFPLVFLALFLLWGRWLITHSPDPDMDVVSFHRDSLAALLEGKNPYAIHFHFPRGNPAGYPPGMAQGGWLLFGYPYMPLNLLLSVPGHLLGDYRYSLLLALALTGLLLWLLAPGPRGALAMALLLLTPRILYQLELGWTEPFALCCLLACTLAAVHQHRSLPVWTGLLLSCKQYMPFLLPSAVLLRPLHGRGPLARRAWLQVALTAAAVTLPFVAASPQHFWRDVFTVQMGTPYRSDALNFSAWAFRHYGVQCSPAWGFLAAALALGLCYARLPKTPAGFCLAFATVFLWFLALNRQAFANYYLLIQAALLAAFAAANAQATGRYAAAEPAACSVPRGAACAGTNRSKKAART